VTGEKRAWNRHRPEKFDHPVFFSSGMRDVISTKRHPERVHASNCMLKWYRQTAVLAIGRAGKNRIDIAGSRE